ncbi:MAG: phosphatase PAP2 family protein, partial [Saprospiraceae bacterium]
MTTLQTLLNWDTQLFHFINASLANPIFDLLLPWCREKWFWAPVYLFVAAFTLLNFRKRGWIILLGLVAVVFITDGTSSELIKKNVRRLRPCNEPTLSATVQLRTDC